MQMHAIRTAVMTVKNNYYHGRGGVRAARLTSVLLDTQWRDIPVYAWVIEHPEGLIVIDTGETAKVNDSDYFPAIERPYWRSQYRFHITPEDEIGAQMRRLNLSPDDVRWLLLTHTHFDHTDALYHFPKAEVLVSRKERDDTYRWRSAHFAFPSKFPDWFEPRPIDYKPRPLGAFTHSYPVTQAGDVHLVPTPGHTSGHQSVVLQSDDGLSYFFGGDTSFDLESLKYGIIDAPAVNAPQTLQTRQRIIATARQTPLVYLTTHDPDTAHRLENRVTLDTVLMTSQAGD